MKELATKFESRAAQIAVVGVGQVGLPFAVAFARAGFVVHAFDTSPGRLKSLLQGESHSPDVPSELLRSLVHEERLIPQTNPAALEQADAIIISVPTPLNETREPDLRHVTGACRQIAEHLSQQTLVVIESTTYPGATEEVLLPLLNHKQLTLGDELFLAFSPERIDPGNPHYGIENTPKVISGVTPQCLEMVKRLYSQVVKELVVVSSTRAAETVKLLENTFRAVNIALVNELSLVARKLGVDAFEVVDAAGTKPFGYMPFYPGPGLGGHCIPVDPLYLSWKLRNLDFNPELISVADTINAKMPLRVVARLEELLLAEGKSLGQSHVLIYGVGYKANVADCRESPGIAILRGLLSRNAQAAYQDPFVPTLIEANLALSSVDEAQPYSDFDAVVIATEHTHLPAERLLREASLILDTRGTLRRVPIPNEGSARVYGM